MIHRMTFSPTLALLFAASFWGAVWYPLRLLEANGLLGTWQTIASFTAAALILSPFVWQKMNAWRLNPYRLLALALVVGWTNAGFMLAMLEGEVVRVLLLFYLSPLWTALFGRWLLGEHWTRKTFLMLGLGLSGALITLWDPGLHHESFGDADILALSSGMSFALANVLNRKIDNIPIDIKALSAIFGSVVVGIILVGIMAIPMPEVSVSVWLSAAALGIFGFLLATQAVTYGVTHMPAQRSSVIMLMEIVVGALSAWWLADSIIGQQEMFGGLLIVSAGLIAAMNTEESSHADS